MPRPGPSEPLWIERTWIETQERLLNALDRLDERLHPGRMAPHLRTGLRGERAALFELRRRGYIVVASRWRTPKHAGDIDLIAWLGETLCFVEVKARTARDLTPAAAAVDDHRRRRLRRLAAFYLHSFPAGERRRIETRLLVASVYLLPRGAEVELLPSAFPV